MCKGKPQGLEHGPYDVPLLHTMDALSVASISGAGRARLRVPWFVAPPRREASCHHQSTLPPRAIACARKTPHGLCPTSGARVQITTAATRVLHLHCAFTEDGGEYNVRPLAMLTLHFLFCYLLVKSPSVLDYKMF
jgi:hypothetical protein